MLKVPTDPEIMGGVRAKEVAGLILFGAPPSEVDLDLFFLKNNLISMGIALIVAKFKMTR